MRLGLAAVIAVLALAACGKPTPRLATEGVTDAMIAAAPEGEWLSYGRDNGEQRFSPLTGISVGTIGKLGLAWFADLDTARGQEATPLMHDGVLFISTAWSMVKAYDARTGALKWAYDPKVLRETLARACCDAVNRGVALYGDKVYVGTLDGRLVALDAKTGKEVFAKVVVPTQADYTITSAPRIAKGMVLLGSGGAEFKARGYLAAYSAETGEEVWKFHTVPGDPARGFENKAMEEAAKTWAGEWWKLGGGGTVWEAITYDPVTNLVYFGTGNAEPWNPDAKGRAGDSLYTSSIVAVNADTGRYAWHFQETPEDRWDYDSNAPITVADLTIGGENRHVILHAPKNGYFYVLDAKTGKFVSAKAYAPQTWTKGIDPVTGRPEIAPEARYEKTGKPYAGLPGALGAHSWQSMSFSPSTGLVYIPAQFAGFGYSADQNWRETAMGYQIGLDPALGAVPMPALPGEAGKIGGALIAWDPVAQKEVWRASLSLPANGGALATAGNLVFQGGLDGKFQAYSADQGKPLWSFDAQSAIIASPMSYALDGEQYIAIMVGWGGGWGGAPLPGATRNISRLLVFKLGGTASLPPRAEAPLPPLDPPPFTGTVQQVARGSENYGRFCFACHGFAARAGAINPDLRRSAMLNDAAAIKSVVVDGALKHNAMPSFKPALDAAGAEDIRQFLIKRANDDKAAGGT